MGKFLGDFLRLISKLAGVKGGKIVRRFLRLISKLAGVKGGKMLRRVSEADFKTGRCQGCQNS